MSHQLDKRVEIAAQMHGTSPCIETLLDDPTEEHLQAALLEAPTLETPLRRYFLLSHPETRITFLEDWRKAR
jgi:hypothetical protein